MKSALPVIEEIKSKIEEIGVGKIATVIGRYYAMDRDNRWERVNKAYDALVLGRGIISEDIEHAINMSYEKSITDEFFDPIICMQDAEIKENDSIIFFNFRPDRARQITRAFVDPDFKGFEREKGYFKTHFLCMTEYDKAMPNVSVAFKSQNLNNTLGEYLSKNGFTQLRIAETEKYAHVTFFFNGGVETVYDGETRILIPSPKVATYDMQPEMSAEEVTNKVLEAINGGTFDLIVLNYANCDMVGHTGDFQATVKSVEVVDQNIGKVVSKMSEVGGVTIVTADHGNADQMLKDDNSPMTAHTSNKVPFILVGKDCTLKDGGKLADVAPTILDIMNVKKPTEMTGETLINHQ
jgi:2,3-bisphosphoglycerate-independent phosphoglycerate mutase